MRKRGQSSRPYAYRDGVVHVAKAVAKICSEWDDSCWPREMLVDEHESIVDVTGVATPSPSAYVDHNDKSWWYDQACMSEGETESNDAKSQTGSDDGQALDECQDNTHTDKKWEGPDYDEDLNNPETSENEKGIRGGSRADALKRLRACSRRLVCRWLRGLPQEQEISCDEL